MTIDKQRISRGLNWKRGVLQLMTCPEAMHDYYSGQQYFALAGALVAILYMLIARVAYLRRTYPALVCNHRLSHGRSLYGAANLGYFFYHEPQAARIGSALTRSQSEFNASEGAHLNSMMNGFHRSYRLDSTVALLSLLTVAAGLPIPGNKIRSNKAIGAGLAIALCATKLLAGEVGSKHRALQYREALLSARGAG